jgi:hypothetical protein
MKLIEREEALLALVFNEPVTQGCKFIGMELLP